MTPPNPSHAVAWTCIQTEVGCHFGRDDVVPGMIAALPACKPLTTETTLIRLEPAGNQTSYPLIPV